MSKFTTTPHVKKFLSIHSVQNVSVVQSNFRKTSWKMINWLIGLFFPPNLHYFSIYILLRNISVKNKFYFILVKNKFLFWKIK